jgi:phosphatidylserine decarboxylase
MNEPTRNSLLDTLSGFWMPIHKEGYPFIAAFAGVTFLLALISSSLGIFGAVLTAWCVAFFRDPARVTPSREGLVICPADGVMQQIREAVPPMELGMGTEPRTRLSIFMNVFNCHVNRIPVDGRITGMHYFPGSFLNASLDKASDENERQAVRITTPDGEDIAVVQIAGLVARRIVTSISRDQKMAAGERFGIIRFGSRVDVYLPKGVEPLVMIGQTMVAGETILADLKA